MNKRESSFLNAAKLRTTLYIEEVLQKIAVMNFFSMFIVILALSLTSVVCDTGAEADIFVPNLNLQKELQDIRNQIYHESTIRLQFDKELSSMARRYRTLIVDQTNAKIENNKTKTALLKLEQSVQNLQQNTTEKLNKFETDVTSFALVFQTNKKAMNDSSKKVNILEAAFHELQRNFTESKIKLDTVSQTLQEAINTMNEQFAELNSSIVQMQSTTKEHSVRDCGDVETNSPDGVYRIYPSNGNSVEAYCKISNGRWTVFQRRMNGQTNFYRGWTDYRDGFGDPNAEFWLGNKYIHQLTDGRLCSLRIEMTDWKNKSAYAEYSTFRLDNETDGFKLHVGGFTGNRGNYMVQHNGMKFTTKDRDQDTHSSKNCAVFRSGAWWYYSCVASNLNGDYNLRVAARGVYWGGSNMKKTEMMLKCS